MTKKEYAAVLDGSIFAVRPSRAEATADARWLRSHPARTDRVNFGHGGRVQIVTDIREDEWSDLMLATDCATGETVTVTL